MFKNYIPSTELLDLHRGVKVYISQLSHVPPSCHFHAIKTLYFEHVINNEVSHLKIPNPAKHTFKNALNGPSSVIIPFVNKLGSNFKYEINFIINLYFRLACLLFIIILNNTPHIDSVVVLSPIDQFSGSLLFSYLVMYFYDT
jgi:hypothetical protein